jgi:hypothetical protein
MTKYHYFCTDGSSVCDRDKIGYIHVYGGMYSGSRIDYLPLGGYDNIEDLKDAMTANSHDSNAKVITEKWFEDNNLDGHEAGTKNYENDLEDTVYCNDRTFYAGALLSKDSSGSSYSYYDTARRIYFKDNNNYNPSFNCLSKRDSFTKNETSSTNGKLKYMIGLATADEYVAAGVIRDMDNSESYIASGSNIWTMSPEMFFIYAASNYYINVWSMSNQSPAMKAGLRPVVSLKTNKEIVSGVGTIINPYIVE